jgi:glycosyltransferase involved in cell wall biosynthesis
MEQAARWILDEVLPEVLKVFPDLHFYIVGKGSKEVLQDVRKPQVTITGMLPSVLPYLCHADVALVPLKFESGTRFKILEAAACVVPIVSTTLGAEGIPVEDGKHILIADEADAFVEAIVQLINDKSFAHGIAKNCYGLVKKDYSIEALTIEAEAILERLSK